MTNVKAVLHTQSSTPKVYDHFEKGPHIVKRELSKQMLNNMPSVACAFHIQIEMSIRIKSVYNILVV